MVMVPSPEVTWACARADGTRHGAFVTLFPDDTTAITGAYRDGKLDGPWARHHASGPIAEEGSYLAGHKHGTWRQRGAANIVLGEYTLDHGTGVEKRWYDSGAIYSARSLRASVPHGAHQLFGHDGSVISSASYADGKLDGAHTFGTRATMRFEETLADGVLRGPRAIWLLGAQIADERYDRRGRLDGAYTLWRRARVMRAKGQFRAGARVGPWVWFDRANHKEKAGSYVGGQRDGVWQEWWERKLSFSGRYTAGKPDGAFVYYDRRGRELGTFTITGGTGTMLTFHTNRKPSTRQQLTRGVQRGRFEQLSTTGQVIALGHYEDDVKHGTWKEWTAARVPTLEQTWTRGRLDGPIKKYVDGVVAMEATYVDGKAHGPYTEYRQGKPAVTGELVDDRKHGTWTTYDANGTVILTATYAHGVLDGPWRQLMDGVVIEGVMARGRRTGPWTRTDPTP